MRDCIGLLEWLVAAHAWPILYWKGEFVVFTPHKRDYKQRVAAFKISLIFSVWMKCKKKLSPENFQSGLVQCSAVQNSLFGVEFQSFLILISIDISIKFTRLYAISRPTLKCGWIHYLSFKTRKLSLLLGSNFKFLTGDLLSLVFFVYGLNEVYLHWHMICNFFFFF